MRGQLVLLVIMALTPFLALAALRSYERAARAREAAEERVLAAARQVRWRVEDRAHTIRAALAAAAHAVRPERPAAAANDSVLRAILDGLGDVDAVSNLWVHDAAGENVGTSLRPVPPRASVFAGDRRYFRDVLRTGRRAVGDPVRARGDTTRWTVTFAEPLRDAGGAVRGAVLGTVVLRSFARTFAQAGLPRDAEATLVDARGVVLGRTHADSAWLGRPLHGAGARPALPPEGVSEVPGADGVRRLVAHTRVPELGWRVYVSLPRRAALADAEREIRRDVLLALLTLAVSLALALAVARRLVRPLEALAGDAQRLAAGEPPAAARPEATGELATLADAFHEMAATIAARTAALHGSEQRHRLMFDASPLPIYMVDLETYRFLAVNDAAVAQYGWSREEFAGRRCSTSARPRSGCASCRWRARWGWRRRSTTAPTRACGATCAATGRRWRSRCSRRSPSTRGAPRASRWPST
jgi:PAS domain-containing protein